MPPFVLLQPDVEPPRRPISAQPLLGMDGSVAMALFMIVTIPDLAHTYMEPMETASNNLHAFGLTSSPQGSPFLVHPDVDFLGSLSQLSHSWAWMGVIHGLVHGCKHP